MKSRGELLAEFLKSYIHRIPLPKGYSEYIEKLKSQPVIIDEEKRK